MNVILSSLKMCNHYRKFYRPLTVVFLLLTFFFTPLQQKCSWCKKSNLFLCHLKKWLVVDRKKGYMKYLISYLNKQRGKVIKYPWKIFALYVVATASFGN